MKLKKKIATVLASIIVSVGVLQSVRTESRQNDLAMGAAYYAYQAEQEYGAAGMMGGGVVTGSLGFFATECFADAAAGGCLGVVSAGACLGMGVFVAL